MVTALNASSITLKSIKAKPQPVLLVLAWSVGGPALVSLAFPPFNLSLFALIGLAALFLSWSRLSWKQALLWGWLSGTLLFAALLYWTSLTVFEFVGDWSALALVVLCGIEGSAVAATAVVASLVGRGTYRMASMFAIPAAWLLFESVRSQGSLGVPFGVLGLVAAHAPLLLPLASIGGVYLLTATIALVSAAIAALIGGQRRTRLAAAVAIAMVAVTSAWAKVYERNPSLPHMLRVAIAQGDVEQRSKWSAATFAGSQAVYADLTREAASLGARVVVWPETAITESALQDETMVARMEALAKTTHAWVLAGALDSPGTGGYYNALLDFTPDGSVGGVYHKHWLVPFAEFVPFESILGRLPLMRSSSAFLSGPGPQMLPADGYRFGPLICYESASASYARETANAGADLIVVVTDDAWFDDTDEPYQHTDAAVVQAVATGRWIVRAASTGISAIIDPHGAIVSELGIGRRGVVVGDVGKGVTTMYDRYGVRWLLLLCLAVVLFSLTLAARGRR